MKKALLPVVIIGAFFSGWFLLDFLTVDPLKMSLFLTFTIVAIILTVVSLTKITKKLRLAGILLTILFILAGYLINAKIFLNQEDSRFIPDITRKATDPVPGHTAIIYFTHGEPETYNPIGWINQFKEFDEQEIKFVPFIARPIFVYMLRNRYMEIGKSNHRQVHFEMFKSVEREYRTRGDSLTKFYIAFLDDEPRPDAAVINALNEGAGKIIVANIFLTISNHTAEGQHLIDELKVEENFGVPVIYTEPMWSSTTIRQAFVEKVMNHIEPDEIQHTAVAFVGHGQPDEWDIEWGTETEQEMLFREELINLFVDEGFDRENLGSAWMSFKEPKPAVLMEKFINNGAINVFYFAAAISADAMHSQIDVPQLVEKYDFPDNIVPINLGAWNNHPTVIRAFTEKIDKILYSGESQINDSTN